MHLLNAGNLLTSWVIISSAYKIHSRRQFSSRAVECDDIHEISTTKEPSIHTLYDQWNKIGNVSITFTQQFLQWENNKYYIFCLCVCSFRYPVYNVHAPYCHTWPVRLYPIFAHYLINCMIPPPPKMLLIIKCVFWCSVQLFSATFLCLRRTERDDYKNIFIFM